MDFEFNSSGIFIDQNLQDSVHYGFCNSYSYDQRASIERIVFEDFERDGVLVIYNKNYKSYVSNLKQKFPTASFSELKSNDYDEFISKILNIKESKDRKNTLQGLDKNTNLVFLPRKNQNLKKIFIILDYKDAKAIVPILKSYVLDFPIFATNDLLYEIADPKKILDFEGLFFPLNSNFKMKILLWNRGVYLGFRFLLHFFPREQKRCSRSERSQSILVANLRYLLYVLF